VLTASESDVTRLPACRSKTQRKIICDCRAVHLRGPFLNAKAFATTSNRVTSHLTRIA